MLYRRKQVHFGISIASKIGSYMVRCSAVDPILKTIDIYPQEGRKQYIEEQKKQVQKTINNYRQKVESKQNYEHSEKCINKGEVKNKEGKRENGFGVWQWQVRRDNRIHYHYKTLFILIITSRHYKTIQTYLAYTHFKTFI